MPAVQTTFAERMPIATAGMVANERSWDAITRSVEPAGGIGFGVAVCRGTDRTHQAAIGGAIDLFLGVSLKDVTLVGATADEYPQNANIGIFVQGEIWVQVTGVPGPDDPVHYDATTGVFAASGGTGPVLGARWMETSANSLGRLFLPAYGTAT